MSYSREEIALLSYKELQKLCKQTGLKGHKKHGELVDDLAAYFFTTESELEHLENEMKLYEDVDLNVTYDMPSTKEDESDEEQAEQMKDTLMEEVERRAEEKLSKIPRLVEDKVTIPNIPNIPAHPVTPDVAKQKRVHGIKMDSIDQYLVKKEKRASEHLKFNDNFKENKLPVKRMKVSNSASVLKKRSENKRKSIRIDSDIIINFKPKRMSTPDVLSKPTRVSPRLSALKDANRPKPIIDSSKKSIQQFKMGGFSSRKASVRNAGVRKSAVQTDISSPTLSKQQTPKVKTPLKFDLKASLKKPLSYKPHTGKLKEVYFTQEISCLPRKPVRKVGRTADRKVSVKEITKKLSTRENRRTEVTAKREKNRMVVLDKRRGIVC